MRYTFLLPSYKSTFFKIALKSIKSQNYKEFNVIVSDDCSPENLTEIYDIVIGDDARFYFRRNNQNMGSESLVSHWNLLVDMCDTDYLIMASDDDIYEPNFLQEIDNLVKKYPNADIIRGKAKKIQEENTIDEDDNIPEFLTLEEFLPYFGKKHMVHCLANYVFKTSALKAIGGFPDFPKAGYSDAAAVMALAKNGGIAITKDIVFSFRMSSENLSSVNGYNKYVEEGINGCIMFADWYKANIKPFISKNANNILEIYQAHYNHIVEIAQYFMCRLTLFKAIKYYIALRVRGYMNVNSTFTAIKNWIKVS